MTELWLSYDTHTPVHPSLHRITDFLACIQLVSCLVVVPWSNLLLCVRKVLSEAQSAFSSASDEVAKAEAQIAIEVSQCPSPPPCSRVVDPNTFGFGSRNLAQFRSVSKVMLSIFKEKIKNNFTEKQFSFKQERKWCRLKIL